MSNYSYIAELEGLDNHYLIDDFDSTDEPTAELIKKRISMEGVKVLYIGENYYSPDYDLLNSYKSKINEDFYRIDIRKAFGIIGYQSNKHIYIRNKDMLEQFNLGLKDERLRRERGRIAKVISSEYAPSIFNEYEKLNQQWTEYWLACQNAIKDFYKKNPKPVAIDYESTILFVKRKNEEKYKQDDYQHRRRFESLVGQLAVAAKSLGNIFKHKCAGGCGKKVDFWVYPKGQDDWFSIEPLRIGCYRKISQIACNCKDCGLYSLESFDDKNLKHYTCVSPTDRYEYIDVLEWRFRLIDLD